MSKPLLIVRNISHEGPGLLETALDLLGIEAENVDLGRGEAFPDPSNFSALVVLGGPTSANDDTPSMTEELRQTGNAILDGIPFLGICLGMQALVKAAGGEVVKCRVKEIGFNAPDGSPFRIDLSEA
ncbi:MAG: C26 family cysteine hydrolase domain-containing family, partial [Chlorobiaceae bacterium]|nr:C26 family cysteine hydrolase domain-containing family [Chlorobiaceae bacterium]